MAKYKIKDYVTLNFQPAIHVLQIFEIVETTCPSGTQTIYKGRINGISEEGHHYHSPKDISVREEEIIGMSEQSVIWEEMARIRAEKKKSP